MHSGRRQRLRAGLRWAAAALLAAGAGGAGGCGCERGGTSQPGDGGWLARAQHPAGDTGAVRIRVLLRRGAQVWLAGDRGFRLVEAAGGQEVRRLKAGEGCRISRKEGGWALTDRAGGSLAAWGESTGGGRAATAALEALPNDGGVLMVGEEKPAAYRGRLRCVVETDNSLALVNVVDVEEYLNGVVGSEMPAYWYKAALRVQSIASRTYALYQVHRRGGQGQWDIGSDQASQVYGGVGRETGRVREAVAETRGVVLAYHWEGQEKIFPTYYSSTCGGHTEDAAAVFGEDLAPLKGRLCPYCGQVARPEYYRWGVREIAKEAVSSRLIARYPVLAALRRVVEVRVAATSDYGRVEMLELVGENSLRQMIGGEGFRLAISTSEAPLRSSWYRLEDGGKVWRFVDGRGWGHGVGMCQCGVEGMARQGEDCVAILNYYYPQALLVRAY